jgi:hypothetical protein
MKYMINIENNSEANSNRINYHTIKLIYENISLMDENIRLSFENRKLRKRVERAKKLEELTRGICEDKDVSYWEERAKELEGALKKVSLFCPTSYKNEFMKYWGGSNKTQSRCS